MPPGAASSCTLSTLDEKTVNILSQNKYIIKEILQLFITMEKEKKFFTFYSVIVLNTIFFKKSITIENYFLMLCGNYVMFTLIDIHAIGENTIEHDHVYTRNT